MSRQIKFRAFIPERKKKGMLVATEAYMATQGEPDLETLQSFIYHYGECENLMQYTGLKDKHGKEIYEGDILRVFDEVEFMPETAITDFEVVWGDDYPAFTLKGYEDLEYNSLQHATTVVKCEIVGNIYENKNLLDNA